MKKISNILLIIILAFSFDSCKMDYYPYDNIEQSQSFQSVDDIGTLVNGCYALLRGISYGNYTMPMDIQADLFNATTSYGNNYGIIHSWTQLVASDYNIEYPWAGYYNLIANLNNVIENYSTITPSDSELDAYNTYVGESYYMRAYAYAYLVNIYAKAYSSSTASTDLGVPLNLRYNIEDKLARSTVQEVYDQIFSDLSAAETKWSGLDWSGVETYKNAPCKFTEDAITALKARLYLNMEDWSNAITQAEKIINSGSYPLVTAKEDLATMWESDESTEIITHLYIDGSNETPNSNDAYLMSYLTSTDSYIPYYVPEQWLYDLYDANDYRKAVYFANFELTLATGTFTNIYSLNKYPLTTEFSSSGNYYHSPILFRTAEMYLIVAEAGARGSQSTLGLQRLNELREARGLASLSGLSGDDLFKEVRNERVREMVGEGNRLTDLKRWNLGFTRTTPQDETAVVASFIDLSVDAGDNKFVWAIPSYDINLNSNLVQNTGW
jgi:starch-binding outer membrane protein, SusD/RagB family